ncbi:MAG: peptidoglycan recognition family protein [Cyanobacteria bacterium]|nr:peptidoglycan recognition family protein [Cyanobacteriota bacterium]
MLLQSSQPETLAIHRGQLQQQLGEIFSAAMLVRQAAFLDGLLAGYGLVADGPTTDDAAPQGANHGPGQGKGPSTVAAAAILPPPQQSSPDLRSWIFGVGTGALASLGLFFLGLLASRQFGWDPLASKGQPSTAEAPLALPPPAPVARQVATPALRTPYIKSNLQSSEFQASTDFNRMSADFGRLQACAAQLQRTDEKQAPADSSNYGPRLSRNGNGEAIPDRPQLIVLHETIFGQDATIKAFQSRHAADGDQASYHVLIGRDGQRTRLVPDVKRAYGAGDSAFGDFTIQAHQRSQPSINNVSLHVSLVTPADGQGKDDRDSHSGYTEAQYRGLAQQVLIWQGLYGIPMARVTTHAAVDRSHSRYDPRSFRWDRFDSAYAALQSRCG